MPDIHVPFKVYTDASMDAVGCVLAQDREGLERVVVYASQSLAPTETLYIATARWLVKLPSHFPSSCQTSAGRGTLLLDS